MYIHTHTYIHTHMYLHIYIHISIYIRREKAQQRLLPGQKWHCHWHWATGCVCIFIYTYIHVYTCTQTYTYTSIYIRRGRVPPRLSLDTSGLDTSTGQTDVCETRERERNCAAHEVHRHQSGYREISIDYTRNSQKSSSLYIYRCIYIYEVCIYIDVYIYMHICIYVYAILYF